MTEVWFQGSKCLNNIIIIWHRDNPTLHFCFLYRPSVLSPSLSPGLISPLLTLCVSSPTLFPLFSHYVPLCALSIQVKFMYPPLDPSCYLFSLGLCLVVHLSCTIWLKPPLVREVKSALDKASFASFLITPPWQECLAMSQRKRTYSVLKQFDDGNGW